jgi:hypothetical protein
MNYQWNWGLLLKEPYAGWLLTGLPQRPLAVNAAAQIRIRAAVRHAGSGAEASDRDLAADRDRPLLPAHGRANKRALAADDAARRSGPAPAGLNPSSRAHGRRCGCSVSASG